MSLFTIADLHLSQNGDHAMDVFGSRWQGYTEKIVKRWRAVVTDADTVVVPGDISWGLTLAEARADLAFIDALPGKKLLGKGNHDFWWTTAAKIGRFFAENAFSTLSLLYNNAYVVEDFIVCGTRGWFLEEGQQLTVGSVDHTRIVNRERIRLSLSLDAAKRLQTGENANKEILVFLHFPPAWNGFTIPEFAALMREYGVRRCFFGHIHGNYTAPLTTEENGIEQTLISADALDFVPRRIFPFT